MSRPHRLMFCSALSNERAISRILIWSLEASLFDTVVIRTRTQPRARAVKIIKLT